jgi:hypothetical protein
MKRIHILMAAALMVAAGCTSYYQVTDPTTGKMYYTNKYDQSRSGATSFTDARTGDQVTIQNSQISSVTSQQFENGKNGVEPTTQP